MNLLLCSIEAVMYVTNNNNNHQTVLVGQRPFAGDDIEQIVDRVLHKEPMPMRVKGTVFVV